MSTICVPSDVVLGVLCQFKGNTRFPADVPKAHTAFCKLANSEKFKDLFRGFIFDESRQYPYSADVSFALDRLQQASLLACINPRLNEFMVSESLSKYKASLLKSGMFSKDEIKLLKDASVHFLKAMRE